MTSKRATTAGGSTSPISDPVLFSLIQRLADNKYWLGRRYAEWCTAAPTLESAVASAAMAQDEVGHARSHYPLFRKFTGYDVEPEGRSKFHNMAVLDQPFSGWVDFVACNVLADTAITMVFNAASDSSYDDLRNRARRIAGEEYIHWLHGAGWVKRLARHSPSSKTSLQAALANQWPEVLMWFGKDNAPDASELVARKVVSKTPSELRSDFCHQLAPVFEQADIALASAIDETVNTLPWSEWDGERYRLRG